MDAPATLPNELWFQILGHLNKQDLKALRLCGKRHLTTLSASLLFTTAHVAARRGVLDTFTKLTTHLSLRHHIKEVVFDSSYVTPNLVSQYANDKCGPPLKVLFDEQEQIQKDEILPRLKDAFECLPNVRKVFYADLSRIACLPGDQNVPSWECDYLDGPLIRRLESHTLYDKICGRCLEPLSDCGCSPHADRFRRQHEGLLLLMEVLASRSSNRLVELSLGDRVYASGDGGLSPLFFSPSVSSETRQHLHTVFRSLRKLELSISSCVCPKNGLHSKWLGMKWLPREGSHSKVDLKKLLGVAENLEELKLAGGQGLMYLCIADTLAAGTWNHLQVLHLSHFEASKSELEDLLCRHASSLRSVTLDHFNLTEKSWKSLEGVIEMAASSFELIIGDVFANGGTRNIERYLSRKAREFGVFSPIFESIIPDHDAEDYDQDDEHCESIIPDHDAEEYDQNEEHCESSPEELEYSSDDSSLPTEHEPRRVPFASCAS